MREKWGENLVDLVLFGDKRRMGSASVRMNCCKYYFNYFSTVWLTVGIICNGNPLSQDISESLQRNWHKEELNDLSGDGGLEEPQNSAKPRVETTVPVIYSSFSSPIPHHVSSSSVAHSSFSETLSKSLETVRFPSETQSLLSIDYSIDVTTSETDIEDCQMSHPSLPYSGPSSLLNTFIFRPSLSTPSPTPSWSSTVSFTSSSGLRETSWWEVDEIPYTSHEAHHLSTPLTSSSSINPISSSCTSCVASTERSSDTTSPPFTISATHSESVFSIISTPSSSFVTSFSEDVMPLSSVSSTKDDSLVSSDEPTYFCSTYLRSSLGAQSSETIARTTDTFSVQTERLPVFITDQHTTGGIVSTTYRNGISSSSALNTMSSASDLNIISSASFDTSISPFRSEFTEKTALNTLVTDFNPTWTSAFSDSSPWIYASTENGDSFERTLQTHFSTNEITYVFISVTPSSVPSIHKPTKVVTYQPTAISSNAATEYYGTTSYVTPQATNTGLYYSRTVPYDTTTEASTRSTRPPSTESSTLDDIKYWVKTVVKAEPSILPINFLSIVKGRLARIYDLAYNRRNQASRQKRDVSDVKIQFTKYTADWRNHQVELVYTVEHFGEPVLATKAVDVLEEVDGKEFTEMMGYMIIIKAEVYVRKAEIVEKEQPWVVYAVIGTVGGILLVIVCVLALYFRYCHVKEEKLDTESVRLKMFGQQNRQQAFQEEIHRSQQEVKGAMEVDRPLPQLPFHPVKKSRGTGSERIAKSRSKKRLLVSTETQTEGYYNPAYESDATEASLTSVTSTQTSSDQSSQELLPPKSPAKVPLKPKWPNAQSLSKTATNEGPSCAQFESAKTSLIGRSRGGQTISTALSDTDAGTAEAEIEVGRMRRRITELLDDAFSYADPKRMYSSLRTKPILPTSGAFHRWTSLRSPNRHQLLNDTFNEAKSAESLPDVDPMKVRHEPLFINLPPHKQPPAKPRVVWSIYKAGDEVSELSDEMQAKASQHEALGSSYVPPTKLFEHRVVPPSTTLLQPRPASPSSLIHPSFRPFSAPSIVSASDTLRPPYAIEVRSACHQSTSSSVPLLDTLHESPLSQRHPAHRTKQHHERDEIDTATELKFRQPAQSVIEAIRDELKKFNTSLPSDSRESFA